MPQFLTATLVNITKTLLLQKDYFKDHGIWHGLEAELFKRRKALNNEQLAQVMHSFGVTGNGQKEFYQEMEEVITDSPIPIETEHLEKILAGYTEVDQGSPVFYSILAERIIQRGFDGRDPVALSDLCRSVSRATNVQKGGYGLYSEIEKHIKTELHQGRVTWTALCKVVENLLPPNIGSNEFQLELERFLIANYNDDNLQHIVSLVKGLSLY